MSTAAIVAAVVAAIVAGQLVVMRVVFPRRRRAVASRLNAELADEIIVRPPEVGSYQGATAAGYPTVSNDGMIALTRQRLVFRTLTSTQIDIPVADIVGVRHASVVDEAANAGRQHLIVETACGEVAFCVDDDAAWTASLATATGLSTADLSGTSSSVTSSFIRARRNVKKTLATVFSLLGLAGVLATGVSVAVVAGLTSGMSRHAEGTIVDVVPGKRGYDPVVGFTVPDGDQVRINGWVGSNASAFPIGKQVPVRYNPDNPQDAVIDTYWQVWFVPTLLGIITTPFLLVGISYGWATLAARRRRTDDSGICK
jgi:hypothetical protein